MIWVDVSLPDAGEKAANRLIAGDKARIHTVAGFAPGRGTGMAQRTIAPVPTTARMAVTGRRIRDIHSAEFY